MSANTTETERQAESLLGHHSKQFKPDKVPSFVQDGQDVWDTCDEKDIEADRRLVAEWTNTLQTVIISAAIYSAIVTPFLLEAMKQVPGDPTETTNEILLVISRQLSDPFTPPFRRPPRNISRNMAECTHSLILSLSWSIIAAALALPLLRRVSIYSQAIKGYTPRDRSIKRTLRDLQPGKRRLSLFIETLPFLLIASLRHFLEGLELWTQEITEGSGVEYIRLPIYPLIIGMLLVHLTLIPWATLTRQLCLMVDIPLVRKIYRLVHVVYLSLVEKFGRRTYVACRSITRIFSGGARNIGKSVISLLEKWIEDLTQKICSWSAVDPKLVLQRQINSQSSPLTAHMRSLMRLIHSIDLTPNSRDTLLGVLREITELPASMMVKCPTDIPWGSIFTFLCEPYLRKRDIMEYTEEELECAAFLCKALSITARNTTGQQLKSFVRLLQKQPNEAISASAYLADFA
ncbi:hypothetical protein CPB86DRAFT_620964 [Serendipita vermifera]|nr:hypothetical protein CPB86DRAFT_620964 [Serendipita vermifera]